jgi:hypothetical protein
VIDIESGKRLESRGHLRRRSNSLSRLTPRPVSCPPPLCQAGSESTQTKKAQKAELVAQAAPFPDTYTRAAQAGLGCVCLGEQLLQLSPPFFSPIPPDA